MALLKIPKGDELKKFAGNISEKGKQLEVTKTDDIKKAVGNISEKVKQADIPKKIDDVKTFTNNAVDKGKQIKTQSDDEAQKFMVKVLVKAMLLPGVNVNRNKLLKKLFTEDKYTNVSIDKILAYGPVEAGVERSTLAKVAKKRIRNNSKLSSAASFVAGIPGGIGIIASLPADLLQFYSISIRLSQELAYIYGEQDFSIGSSEDISVLENKFIIYFAAMLGSENGSQLISALTSTTAEKEFEKLSKEEIAKIYYAPVVDFVSRMLGKQITKEAAAKGSEAIPIIGGIVSGKLAHDSMHNMAELLSDKLDKIVFELSDRDRKKAFKDLYKEKIKFIE